MHEADSGAWLRWRTRRLSSNEQVEYLCPHEHIRRPTTKTPVVVNRRGVLIWSPGPPIRLCCIRRGSGMAIAAWWWEVENRFEELAKDADGHVTQALLEQKREILTKLAEVVPRVSREDALRYKWHRKVCGLVRTPPSPPGVKLLGLPWPCTLEDVKNRWQKIAIVLHPDKGGDPLEFQRYVRAYKAVSRRLEA